MSRYALWTQFLMRVTTAQAEWYRELTTAIRLVTLLDAILALRNAKMLAYCADCDGTHELTRKHIDQPLPAALQHPPTQSLDLTSNRLALKPATLRAQCGPCRFAYPARHRDAVDQSLQPVNGFQPVFFLAAAALRLDHHHAVVGNAMIAQGKQALLDLIRQRRLPDRIAQMDGA